MVPPRLLPILVETGTLLLMYAYRITGTSLEFGVPRIFLGRSRWMALLRGWGREGDDISLCFKRLKVVAEGPNDVFAVQR